MQEKTRLTDLQNHEKTQTALHPRTTDLVARLGLQFREIWSDCTLFRNCTIVACAVLMVAFAEIKTGGIKPTEQQSETPSQNSPLDDFLEMPGKLLETVTSEE